LSPLVSEYPPQKNSSIQEDGASGRNGLGQLGQVAGVVRVVDPPHHAQLSMNFEGNLHAVFEVWRALRDRVLEEVLPADLEHAGHDGR